MRSSNRWTKKFSIGVDPRRVRIRKFRETRRLLEHRGLEKASLCFHSRQRGFEPNGESFRLPPLSPLLELQSNQQLPALKIRRAHLDLRRRVRLPPHRMQISLPTKSWTCLRHYYSKHFRICETYIIIPTAPLFFSETEVPLFLLITLSFGSPHDNLETLTTPVRTWKSDHRADSYTSKRLNKSVRTDGLRKLCFGKEGPFVVYSCRNRRKLPSLSHCPAL
jgi:hypothetical protein